MDMAFCTPVSLSACSTSVSLRSTCGSVRPRVARRAWTPARMMADDTGTSNEEEGEKLTSASGILKILRDESKDYTPGTVPRESLGVTRDADGKSNVWPVEPRMAVEKSQQIPKATIFTFIISLVFIALLIIPKLPFTNADQF